MPKYSVDFSKKDADLIPEGIYPCVIDKVEAFDTEEEKIAEGKKPYLQWQFTLADDEYQGRKVWMRTYLTEAASFILVQTLAAMGFEPDDKNNIDIFIDDDTKLLTTPSVVGRLVNVKVGFNTWNNKTTNRGLAIVGSDGQNGSNGQEPLF